MPRAAIKLSLINRTKNKIFFIGSLIYTFPLLIIIILIFPFRRIIISELETRSIGHMSAAVEIFLSEIKIGKFNKKNIYLWFSNKKIANKYLYHKWKQKIFVVNRFLIKPLFFLINNIYFLKFLRSPFRHWKYNKAINWQNVDIHNVLEVTNPSIKFSDEEENLAKDFFKKNNLIKNEYICFMSRSNLYLKDDVSIRDTNINNLFEAMKKICNERNIVGIRMGHNEEGSNLSSRNIVDFLSRPERNEFLEIYLLMNCKFLVSTGTGADHVPILNRRKILYINYADINNINNACNAYIPLMITKKFAEIKSNKLINYDEVFKRKLCEELYERDLNMRGFKSVQNTIDEIYDAICEMDNLIAEDKSGYTENKNQKKFWSCFKNYYPLPKYKTIIPNKFIEKNIELFS